MAKSKTVTVVTLQNRRMATRKGHVIQFKRNEPKTIPRTCLEDAMAIGATPVESSDLPEQEAPQSTAPETNDERRELILEGIKVLHERQDRGDFTANGLPHLDMLKKETGLENIHGTERDTLYDEFKQSLTEEEADS